MKSGEYKDLEPRCSKLLQLGLSAELVVIMENVFKYYEFSAFFLDTSTTFSGNEISFTELNETHFFNFRKKTMRSTIYM